MPHRLMGLNNEYLGRYEKAISEDLEAIRLNPDVAVTYSNLMEVYTPLNRLEEAKAAYRNALERRLDGPFLHADMYVVAFLENDAAEMQRQIDLATSMPGAEDWLFSQQSDTLAFSGRLTKAREFSLRAVDSARRNDLNEVAAIWRMNAVIREVEFGNSGQAREAVEEDLRLADTRDSQVLAALVVAHGWGRGAGTSPCRQSRKSFPTEHGAQ